MTCVVKLGGSLQADALLPSWLEMLARVGTGKAVIVPGGGTFADQVRLAQQTWKFSDVIAHRMALLAMDQFGLQLQGMGDGLVIADSLQGIERAWQNAQTPLWLPSAVIGSTQNIAASWDVTSDSLAAWLARALHATQLILVKSCVVDNSMGITELARQGIVDAGFCDMVRDTTFAVHVVSKTDQDVVARLLDNESQM